MKIANIKAFFTPVSLEQGLLSTAGWLTALAPVSILFGKAVPDIFLSLVAFLFLIEKARTRDIAWAKRPWIALLLGTWLYGIVSTAFSAHGPSLESFAWVRFILFGAALAEWVLPHEKWRKRLLFCGIAMTVFLAADALFQFATGFDIIGRHRMGDRLTAVFSMPKVGLNLSWFFLPLMVGLWREGWLRSALAYGTLCAVTILLSGDRFAFLYTLSLLGLITLIEPHVRKTALWGGLALAVLFGVAVFLFPDIRARQVDSIIDMIAHLPESHYWLIWASTWTIFQDNFLFGVGIQHYREVCQNPIYGSTHVGPMGDLVRCVMHPHHTYLQWMAEMGIIGLMAFLSFIVLVGRTLIRMIRTQKGNMILLALGLALAMRLFPLASSASFYAAWAAMPFWLFLGWALSYEKKLD